MKQDRPQPDQRRIPRAALLLGWAGVIPFAAFALGSASGFDPLGISSRAALVAYAAVILSFMGGAQWGLATAESGKAPDPAIHFSISVLPALAGWLCLFLPPTLALGGLAGAFALLLVYDLWTVRAGWAPSWYGALRSQLTAAVVVILLLAAFLS